MNVTQEIRENWKKLKGMSRKERASYIWTYYKFPILALVLAFCVLFSWIYFGVTTAETALSGILLNCYDSMLSDGSRSGFSEDFLEELQLDPSDYTLSFRMNLTYSQGGDSAAYSDYQSVMTIMSYVAAGELDFITGDLGAMLGLAYQDYFEDLSEVLSREQYEAYAPFFLYIDRAVLEQMNGATGESGEAPPEIPDCRKPETMERPVPVLIDMSGSGALRGVYGDYAETLAFGLVVNAPHPENTLKYIDYLMR